MNTLTTIINKLHATKCLDMLLSNTVDGAFQATLCDEELHKFKIFIDSNENKMNRMPVKLPIQHSS